MKFSLRTSGSTYQDGRYKKQLEKLGFTFKPHDEEYNALYQQIRKSKKQMFHMDWEQDVIVELNTLEDLLQFQKKFGPIILNGNSIEIYDDYRE